MSDKLKIAEKTVQQKAGISVNPSLVRDYRETSEKVEKIAKKLGEMKVLRERPKTAPVRRPPVNTPESYYYLVNRGSDESDAHLSDDSISN